VLFIRGDSDSSRHHMRWSKWLPTVRLFCARRRGVSGWGGAWALRSFCEIELASGVREKFSMRSLA